MVNLGVNPKIGDETIFKLQADNTVMLEELAFLRKQVAELEVENTMLIGEAEELKADIDTYRTIADDNAQAIIELTLQVQVLRDLLWEVHSQADYYHMDGGYKLRDAIEEALNTVPNQDEWIRKDDLEEFSTQMEHGGRISKLYRIKETTR